NLQNQLQGKVAEMENFAGHLEEIFLTVEENFGRQEQNLEQHYNEVLQTLSQRYDDGASALQEEKKKKLESLYAQLLLCGQALDRSKDLIETAQEVHRNQDRRLFLKVMKSFLSGFLINTRVQPVLLERTPLADLSDVKTMMDSINVVPAPSAPVINPQTPNSASQTSLRVCWSLFSDDTVEFYELYYRPVLEEPPADSSIPSPPVVRQRDSSSCPEAALIRWESGNANPVDSYTVELREAGSDGAAESMVAVPACQCLVQLQAGRRYLVSVRAVNIGGPSDRSDVITVSTTGTFFHLLEDTAHPCLSISEDGFSVFYGDEELPISAMALDDTTFTRCVAVLGDLIPVRGRHYWEVEVDEDTEFRVGVAYEDTERNSYLGTNRTSWCMRHIRTPSRHKYEFLHDGWSPDLRITVHPVRVGVALDYERGTLSFFNADLEQNLHTFHCRFQAYVLPCFSLDNPGALTVHNGSGAPEHVFAITFY
uniref:Fibronectin type III and SPRY domain containing 2 n=1 Tax=Kryptolebias marmoratus TaxID=37003 RepID=A0A3Q2ZTE7_KRYMA